MSVQSLMSGQGERLMLYPKEKTICVHLKYPSLFLIVTSKSVSVTVSRHQTDTFNNDILLILKRTVCLSYPIRI